MAKHQPFSAPKRRSLPTINNDTAATLQNWKAKLNKTVKNSLPAPTPYNFAVTSARGGLKITWSPVQTPADTALGSPDGYELLRSVNGTFTDDLQVIPIKNIGQSNYFDSTNGNAQTVSYRIRTTAGTSANPQSVRGPESGVVAHTSIDANDTKSTPSTVLDNYTTSKIRSLARFGNYGVQSAFRTSLGAVGGNAPVPSGTITSGGASSGSSSSSSSSSSSAVTFDQIQSGENQSAQMIVGGGGILDVDAADPGIINATNIQSSPISTTAPTLGQILQFIAGLWTAVSLPTTVNLNGGIASDDWEVGVNGISDVDAHVLSILVNKPVSPARNVSMQVNKFPVSDDYSVSVNSTKLVLVNSV